MTKLIYCSRTVPEIEKVTRVWGAGPVCGGALCWGGGEIMGGALAALWWRVGRSWGPPLTALVGGGVRGRESMWGMLTEPLIALGGGEGGNGGSQQDPSLPCGEKGVWEGVGNRGGLISVPAPAGH